METPPAGKDVGKERGETSLTSQKHRLNLSSRNTMADPTSLAARHVGTGLPVLIVHGWEMSGQAEAFDFEPVFTKREGYRRIYVDLPGMGESPAGNIKDLDSILEPLSTLVEEHILPSSFLLSGSSCGAYLAQALAYRYSDSILGLLLRVPVIEPTTSKRDIDPFTPAIANEAVLSSLSDADKKLLGDISVQTPEYVEILKTKFEATVVPAVAAADSATLDPIRSNPNLYRLTAAVHDAENRLHAPTLVLTGRQDAVVGYRDALPLIAAYPRATFVVLDRADHGLPIDETDLFAALVNDWLGRVEESRHHARLS